LNKVSVVVRNKNEALALEKILILLTNLYSNDIHEIILVDNNSSDNSKEIALNYGCKIVEIEKFSYGRAINLGINNAESQYVLLLSSHAVPVGNNFFKNTFIAIAHSKNIAGVRYINSIENYHRAFNNNFIVKDPLRFGLTAGCCLINKEVWNSYKFDEDLIAIEDKEWSARVVNAGFDILDLNETYFYFVKRDFNSFLERYKKETIAEHQLNHKKFSTPLRSFLSFIKKTIMVNTWSYFETFFNDLKILQIKFEIYENIKQNRKDQ
jgi:rhamnosyltransferase